MRVAPGTQRTVPNALFDSAGVASAVDHGDIRAMPLAPTDKRSSPPFGRALAPVQGFCSPWEWRGGQDRVRSFPRHVRQGPISAVK